MISLVTASEVEAAQA